MVNRFDKKISYLFLKDVVHITYPEGDKWAINSNDPVFEQVLKAISADENSDFFRTLQNNSSSKIALSALEIDEDQVYFQGKLIDNQSIKDYVLQLDSLNIPLVAIEEFLTSLYKNISFNVKTKLFDYLKYHKIPLNAKGVFYVYVCSEKHHCEGDVISFNRGDINDSPLNLDKSDYDVGSLECIMSTKKSALDNIYLCAVAAEDVVAVPYVFSNNKVRVCKYEIVKEYCGSVPVCKSSPVVHNVSYVVDVLGVNAEGQPTYSVKSMHNKISDAVNSFRELCEKVDLFHEVRICSLDAGVVLENKILSPVDIYLREEATTTQLSLELPEQSRAVKDNVFMVVELDTNSVLAENLSQEESLAFALEQRNNFGIKVKVLNATTLEVCVSLT